VQSVIWQPPWLGFTKLGSFIGMLSPTISIGMKIVGALEILGLQISLKQIH